MTDSTNGAAPAENLIPVADVTEEAKAKQAWADSHAQAASSVLESLRTERPFVFVDLGDEGVRVTALVDRQGLEFGVFSLLTTLGDELVGASTNALPPELANNLKMVAAMAHMQRQLQAMVQPQTPANDAKPDPIR